jgi:hypothetical protein
MLQKQIGLFKIRILFIRFLCKFWSSLNWFQDTAKSILPITRSRLIEKEIAGFWAKQVQGRFFSAVKQRDDKKPLCWRSQLFCFPDTFQTRDIETGKNKLMPDVFHLMLVMHDHGHGRNFIKHEKFAIMVVYYRIQTRATFKKRVIKKKIGRKQ